MDSSAYLRRHGWRGTGHSLHPTGRGIKKPLLVSQKLNVLGIGKKKNDIHGDQWWARAFDKSLEGLAVSKSGVIGATDSVEAGACGAHALEIIGAGELKRTKDRGLYAGFVRGEGLDGTIMPEPPPVVHAKSAGRDEANPAKQRHKGTTKALNTEGERKLQKMLKRRR